MQQPADIGRELLRLRTRQQHAVVQRVQEPALGNPVLFLDQDAVHHRDLPGRPAEAQQRHLQPDPKGLAEADAVTGIRSSGLGIRSDVAHGSALVGRPVVGFAGRIAAPAVEGVVERDAGLELFEIVVIHPRQAERGRQQARRFRRQIEPPGIGGAHHGCQPQQRRRREAEFLDHHIEGAEFAAMAPEHVFDVEGCGIEALADRDHLRRRHEQEHRVGIDEPSDQPRAGDAVDLRPRAGHPDRASLCVARGQLFGGHQRQLGGLPAFKAALQGFRRYVGVPQPGRGAFRQLLAAQTDDDGRLPGELIAPVGGVLVAASDRAGDQPRIGGKVLVGAHVDQDRRLGRADQASKFIWMISM